MAGQLECNDHNGQPSTGLSDELVLGAFLHCILPRVIDSQGCRLWLSCQTVDAMGRLVLVRI